nr:MAG TPA: hypothetical protein [Caudoviricetes sp.]
MPLARTLSCLASTFAFVAMSASLLYVPIYFMPSSPYCFGVMHLPLYCKTLPSLVYTSIYILPFLKESPAHDRTGELLPCVCLADDDNTIGISGQSTSRSGIIDGDGDIAIGGNGHISHDHVAAGIKQLHSDRSRYAVSSGGNAPSPSTASRSQSAILSRVLLQASRKGLPCGSASAARNKILASRAASSRGIEAGRLGSSTVQGDGVGSSAGVNARQLCEVGTGHSTSRSTRSSAHLNAISIDTQAIASNNLCRNFIRAADSDTITGRICVNKVGNIDINWSSLVLEDKLQILARGLTSGILNDLAALNEQVFGNVDGLTNIGPVLSQVVNRSVISAGSVLRQAVDRNIDGGSSNLQASLAQRGDIALCWVELNANGRSGVSAFNHDALIGSSRDGRNFLLRSCFSGGGISRRLSSKGLYAIQRQRVFIIRGLTKRGRANSIRRDCDRFSVGDMTGRINRYLCDMACITGRTSSNARQAMTDGDGLASAVHIDPLIAGLHDKGVGLGIGRKRSISSLTSNGGSRIALLLDRHIAISVLVDFAATGNSVLDGSVQSLQCRFDSHVGRNITISNRRIASQRQANNIGRGDIALVVKAGDDGTSRAVLVIHNTNRPPIRSIIAIDELVGAVVVNLALLWRSRSCGQNLNNGVLDFIFGKINRREIFDSHMFCPPIFSSNMPYR